MEDSVQISSHTIETKAVFSDCGKYRYSLSRKIVGRDRKITFIMFNPNVRDDIQLGPTANFCFNYAVKHNFGEMELVNLFALRSESISKLKDQVRDQGIDPVGYLNDYYIKEAVKGVEKVVLAWGADGGFKRRDKEVLQMLENASMYCFKKTSKGKPEYPKRTMDIELMKFE
ncbi:hypothetical protein CEW92_03830 [Bacillaceae bacterium SAS-127]|nr:hypothetical protein CEW92_03830 [Bacillaceae bacterium SAS-127]